jgi:hypothetical protein
MTATMKRSDIHRPSAIDPEAYRFVTVLYLGGADMDPGMAMMNAENRRFLASDMERTGGRWSRHEHGGTCHVCGAHAAYVAVYQHVDTLEYIQMGEDCAGKLDMGDVAAFNPLRRSIANAREAMAGKRKAAAVLQDAGLARAWELYEMNSDTAALVAAGAATPATAYDGTPTVYNTDAYNTLCDVVRKLVKYGHISDRQEQFLASLVACIENANAIAAARVAEREAAAPCPTGRVVIEGVVVKLAESDGMYGTTWKMTVKADGGWLAWGTAPAGIEGKGARVRFKATLTPSDNDPKFGFFKRPASLEIISSN